MRSHRRPGPRWRVAAPANHARRAVWHQMTGTIESTTGPRRRARRALAFAALCAALIGVIAVSSAGARDAKVLGKTKRTPSPDCPTDTCATL